mgnify:FL=1
MNNNQNPFPIALFLGITGGIALAFAIGAYQLVTGMSQAAKDTAGIVLAVLSVAGVVIIGIVFALRHSPARRHAEPPPTIDTRPYHIQHPLPRPAQLTAAPAGPQYDETLIYTPPQSNRARNWAIVDEVKQ